MFTAGMNPRNRPIGTMLFLGPTGSGKTRVVEAAAEVLFEHATVVTKIDCAEFQHSHEIAKLIGSPEQGEVEVRIMKRIRTIKKALIKNRKLSQRTKRPSNDELELRDDMKVRKSDRTDDEAHRSQP